jgi:SAM-dependent methyltransferase
MQDTAVQPPKSEPKITLENLPPVAGLPSREFGLALGYILGHHLLNIRDLHYGYWPDDLPVEMQNLAKAQANYTELLISKIPKGVKTILDVGCGVGNTARKLLDRGYQVDCVSPNGFLTSVAIQMLTGRAKVFESTFQEFTTDKRYDLILFSESLLFIRPLEDAFAKALSLLNSGGHILITDIFQLPMEGKPPIGGGHHITDFRSTIARQPFEPVEDVDMTEGIARTFDLLDQTYREALQPAYHMILTRIADKYPLIMKFVRWKFRKKIEYYEKKHFSGRRDGKNFKKYKAYRLLLYKRTA